jgi:predicted MFS family arabinose efflux permease
VAERGAHESLLVAAGLAMAPAVTLGFARFAYGLLLPEMRDDLGWSYAEAGLMNTANAVGYLLGALAAPPVGARIGSRRGLTAGMLVTGLALLLSAATASFPALLTFRLAAGVAAGVSFVAGSTLAARLASQAPSRATLILGIYVAGGGLGIVVSGVLLQLPLGSWRAGWLALGVASLLLLPGGRLAVGRVAEVVAATGQPALRGLHGLWIVLAAYGLFGLGYIGFVTFGVAYLRARGTGEAAITGFWLLLGVAAMAGPIVWTPALDRLSGGRGLTAVLGVLTVGATAPLALGGPLGLVASGALFGGCFLVVPAAVNGVVRRTAAPGSWSAALGGLTTAFATGQCLGPLLAGLLSDRSGGLAIGLGASAAVLAAAALLALAHREPRPAWG